MKLEDHPTVRRFSAGRKEKPMAPMSLDGAELRRLALDCGAHDSGLVELSRPGLDSQRDEILRNYPDGFTAKVHHMDARVGGTYKMSFTNFSTGKSHSFGGTYRELAPHERICYTDKFDDSNLPGEMLTTVTVKKVSCGTELTIVQEGLPEAIPAEA